MLPHATLALGNDLSAGGGIIGGLPLLRRLC